MANVTAECRSCGNEEEFALALDEHYTDSQLADQLDNAPECGNCREVNWSIMEVRH